jgi:hypothetical protein
MNKKIILIIVALAVVVGLGFLAIKPNNNSKEGGVEVPTPSPQTPIENPKPAESFSEFGKAITLKLNGKINFSDGLKVILTVIDDSRCKPNVQCIWAGELALVLEVSGGKISDPGEIHLGTTNNKSVTVQGYTFSLKSAAESSATIVVVKN